MITLKNDQLSVTIKKQGAELASVVDRATGYEFLWQADETYWGRHAPVLFPIVGRLKDNQYLYKGHLYEMNQHGFARDSLFEVVECTDNSALFRLESTEDTKKVYPFDFTLYIQHQLLRDHVITKYKVVNVSKDEPMYYAIGGHPAFNVAHKETEDGQFEFDQVSLQIEPHSELIQYPLNEQGLIKEKEAFQVYLMEMPLTHETFKNDALVYKLNKWSTIELKDKTNRVYILIQTSNLYYLGIWSPYPAQAPFVCIEPWAGIADAEETSGKLEDKIGIHQLEPTEEASHEFSMWFQKEE